MIEVQFVSLLGRDLSRSESCPRCRDPITPADGNFVAVLVSDHEPLRFHLGCYEAFVGGLVTFREQILSHCTCTEELVN